MIFTVAYYSESSRKLAYSSLSFAQKTSIIGSRFSVSFIVIDDSNDLWVDDLTCTNLIHLDYKVFVIYRCSNIPF